MDVGSLVQAQVVATNDFYFTQEGTALVMAAPGVLANDTGGQLAANLVSPPANGTLILNTNGSFTYTPTNNFTGMDGFTYQAVSGSQTSSVASVDLMVLAPGQLFYDTFSRPTNNGSIFPWTAVSGLVGVGNYGISNVGGTWGITNSQMRGTGTNFTYGYTYCGNTNWTDYSVQAQIRFSANYAASAGLIGRVNPITGAHYSVWIYPEQSDEYNIPPLNGIPRLWLFKHESWTAYTNIGQWSSLPAVGTNWHSLKMTFQGSNISAYFDGNLVTNVTDNGSLDGQPAYSHGCMGLNLWISSVPYTFSVENLSVTSLVAVADDVTYTMTPATGPTLNVPAPGVLTNDTGAGPLTALLVAGPADGTFSLTNNGGFSYSPTNGFLGTDSFTYQCTDGQTTSAVATVAIVVSNVVFDLAIGESAATTVPADGSVVYTISVTNNGPSTANNVSVTDALPPETSFVSASGSWTTNGQVVTWNLGTLANGQVSNLTLTITAPSGGTLTNVATVGPLLYDPNPSNNASTPVVTTVTPVITSIGLTDGAADIAWTSVTGATYQVQYEDALDGSNWIGMSPDITATNSLTEQTNVPGNAAQRFYRILLVPP